MVDSNKIERAADLINRLHNEVSFDLAIQIAGRHDKLADIIEEVKFNKFSPADDGVVENDYLLSDAEVSSRSPETTLINRFGAPTSHNVSPDAGLSAKSKREGGAGSAPFQSARPKKQRIST